MATAAPVPARNQTTTRSTTPAYGTKMETYDNSSPEVKALIRQLNSLASASTLEQHSLALKGFDEDCTLDTPFLFIQGRERIRVLSALSKFFLGRFEIEPKLVKISVPESGSGPKGGLLDVDGIIHWLPHRPWYLPLTLLLPKDIPIYADVSLGVKARNDKVYFVSGKNHNLPHVPRILRVVAGFVAGTAVSVVEPIYHNLREWYNAGMHHVNNATHQVGETAQWGTDMVKETAAKGYEAVKDTTTSVVEKVKDTTQKGVDTVKDVVA